MLSEPFSLRAVLEKMSDRHRTRAREQGTQLIFEISPDVPNDLAGDSLSLSQILDELVGNAVEHTQAGKVVIEAEPVDGERRYDDGTVSLRFTVADTGDGMTGEQVLALHDLFTHSDASGAISLGVAGPGLTLCRKLVNVMGGAMTVESERDTGTLFTFMTVLDVHEGPDAQSAAARTVEDGGGPGYRLPEGMERLRNALVLLVEDNPVNQTLTRDLLTYAGFRVDLAENGEEAVRAVQDSPETYAAIFMDVQMPVMDGLEATRRIRAAAYDLPIIATSANTRAEERDRCIAAGADDCLPKPFHIPDFYGTILRWIEPGEGGASEEEPPAAFPTAQDAENENALPERIGGIDLSSGLARVLGNRTLYARLLMDFAHANAGLGDEIDGAVEDADVARVGFLLHGLKSTAGNIGAEDLCSAAIALELALEAQSADFAAQLKAFQVKLNEVVAAIQAAEIPERPTAVQRKTGATPFDLDEARLLANALQEMLEDQDLGAQEQLDRLAEVLGGRGHDKSLERLEASVDALDFAEASQILERVCQELAN